MDEMYRVVAINSFFFEELPAGSEGEASVIHFGPYSPLPDSSRKDLKEHDLCLDTGRVCGIAVNS